ncbi:MAG: hypothetical protein ACPL3C_02160 [Pyrobaculum sp.]
MLGFERFFAFFHSLIYEELDYPYSFAVELKTVEDVPDKKLRHFLERHLADEVALQKLNESQVSRAVNVTVELEFCDYGGEMMYALVQRHSHTSRRDLPHVAIRLRSAKVIVM